MAVGKTLGMRVRNVGFLVDRLGQDCHPLQFIRELTQNSIDVRAKQIRWTIDFEETVNSGGIPKLCIEDGGEHGGMTPDQLRMYINQLSSSSSVQSFTDHSGIGAKIAGATRNHAGMIYSTWTGPEDPGAQAVLWKDPETGEYGFEQLTFDDGEERYGHIGEPPMRPEICYPTGTKVTLIGNDYEYNDDTTQPPPGMAFRSLQWIAKYLNSHYFVFPDGTEVRAPEWRETDGERKLTHRVCHGARYYIDRHALASGTVPLTGATAHWWIVKPKEERQDFSMLLSTFTFVAALFQSELYEFTDHVKTATLRLRQFGISYGQDQVVIVVEPHGPVAANAPRTLLSYIDDERQGLPWLDWAEDFQAQLPQEIRDLIERSIPETNTDYKKSIRERLRSIMPLLKLSLYKPLRANGVTTAVTAPTGSLVGLTTQHGSNTGRGGNRKAVTPRPRMAKPLYEPNPGGDPLNDGTALPLPEVNWISVKNGTRTPGELEDRAAEYIKGANPPIIANADFRGYTDMIDRWEKQYQHVPGCRPTIEQVVHEWFEQNLQEIVASCLELRSGQLWTEDDVDSALTAEALTAAMLCRYHVDIAVKRTLGVKLGSLKERAVA